MRRGSWVVAMGGVAAIASANSAMGFALESFALVPWIVYVVVTIVFEAYWIGVRGGETWAISLRQSFLANAVTAVVGGVLCCGGLLAPLMHFSVFGSLVQPRPFLDAIAKVALFGALSAPIEAVVWSPRDARSRMKSSFVAHLIGVPVSLAILLAPSRPYVGAEGLASSWRRIRVMSAVSAGLKDSPVGEQEFRAKAMDAVPELDVCLRRAEFGRFDVTGLGPSMPLEYNSDPNGRWRVRWNGMSWDGAGRRLNP